MFPPMSRPTVLQSILTVLIPSVGMVGAKMAGEIHRLRERQSESEKITINVGFVDLGHIDLLVADHCHIVQIRDPDYARR